jgi:hypothetical protein
MDILNTALHALWQILTVGILLGVGLPALFALGIRVLNAEPKGLAGAPVAGVAGGKPSAAAVGAASVCFGLCILAILVGIVVILYGKQLFGA